MMRFFSAIKDHMGWYGIVMMPVCSGIIAASYIDHTLPWWGALLLVAAAYVFCRSEETQKKRLAWEHAEYLKVRNENRELRDQLKKSCRDLSRLS